MESRNDHALLNACVLGNFFKFMDVDTLAKSRLVCQTWNTVAGLELRKRTTVCFETAHDFEKFHQTMNTTLEENSRRFKNFRMHVSNETTWKHAEKTLITFRNSLESLHLILSPSFSYNKRFAQILHSLPILEQLEIRDYSCPAGMKASDFPCTQFTKLKACSLHCDPVLKFKKNDENREDPKTQFLVDLLKSSQHTLKKLELKELPESSYKEVFQQVNLKGLTHLTLGSFELIYPKIPLEVIESLPNLCPNLENFEYCFPREVSFKSVQNLFSNMTNLKNTKIRSEVVCWQKFMYSDCEDIFPMPTFPTLPNVKTVMLDIPFSGDVGVLGDCFPQVTKLKVLLMISEEHHWKPMPHLEEIHIKNQESMKSIDEYPHVGLTSKNFPHLTKLVTRLGNGCAKHVFKNLVNLKVLMLYNAVTEEDITGIRSEHLVMADEGKIVRSNPYIGNLQNLQVLNIGHSCVSAHAIKYGIADLDSLTKLIIKCPREPADGLDTIQENSIPKKIQFLKPGQAVDLEPLMLPKVKHLVELIIIIERWDPFPVDLKQLEQMKRARPGFSFNSITTSELRKSYNSYKCNWWSKGHL